MNTRNNLITLAFGVLFIIAGTGCSPEVGSKAWCENLNEKPKGDWTANEAAEYTKSCLFK
jgi:hypothetical protein